MDPAERQVFCLTDAEVEELALAKRSSLKNITAVRWMSSGLKTVTIMAVHRASPSGNGPESRRYQRDGKLCSKRGRVKTWSKVVRSVRRLAVARSKYWHIDEMDQVEEGDILVTDMTDPDWEPVMKRASAIVTNRGGRTCHAAIIACELGIPAVVGAGDVEQLTTGQSL